MTSIVNKPKKGKEPTQGELDRQMYNQYINPKVNELSEDGIPLNINHLMHEEKDTDYILLQKENTLNWLIHMINDIKKQLKKKSSGRKSPINIQFKNLPEKEVIEKINTKLIGIYYKVKIELRKMKKSEKLRLKNHDNERVRRRRNETRKNLNIKDLESVKEGGRRRRNKKTRKMNKLSLSDYRKILKFYKMKIPKSASKIRKEGNKIIAKKFCSCIKKVRKKFKKEGIAIGICTKSVITRKNIKRGKFKCKKRRTIKLYKGGVKKSKKNQYGGVDPPNKNRQIEIKMDALTQQENQEEIVLEQQQEEVEHDGIYPIGTIVSLRQVHHGVARNLFVVLGSRRLPEVGLLYRLQSLDRINGRHIIILRLENLLRHPQVQRQVGGNSKDKNGGHPRPLISHEDEEYEGGNKSKKIKDIVKIFKQYPDIFPRGYFRYLPATLEKHDKKGTLIYKNGVVLTYTKYKKTVNKYKKYKIKPGDVKLNQLVNKNQGNGKAKKIFLKFMEKHKDSNLLLDVLASNKKAIKFYRKNGFKKIDDTKFGDKLKGIVMLKRSKKNKTRKK